MIYHTSRGEKRRKTGAGCPDSRPKNLDKVDVLDARTIPLRATGFCAERIVEGDCEIIHNVYG